MFRSAAGNVPSTPVQRVSANSYSSFKDLTSNKDNSQRKRHRASSSSSSDGNDSDIIVDRVKIHKEKKKKKKSKKSKKSKKKRRHNDSVSSDDSVVLCTPNKPSASGENSDFIVDRGRLPGKYNYAFEKALKKRSLRSETNLPLTLTRNQFDLKNLFYPNNERKENDDRYYSLQVREPFLKVASERVFRQIKSKEFLSEDGMELSTMPWDPSEGGRHTYHDDYPFEFYDETGEGCSKKSEKFDEYANMSTKQRIRHIQQEIKFDESDAEKWLKFLKLEDEDFKIASTEKKNSANSFRNLYLERRLAIIERSLENVSHSTSLKLELEKVQTMTELYGFFDQRVTDYWKKIQNRHINSLEVWDRFIQQLLHNKSDFRLDKMLVQFDTVIQKLVSVYLGTLNSHDMEIGTDKFLIDLVVNRSRLLMEAGHVHQVVAIVQAVAEYYFFVPDLLKDKHWPQRLEAFKNFWTSGVPMLGDKNAKGWKNSVIGIEERNAALATEQYFEAETMNRVNDLEVGLIETLKTVGANRLFAWSELEQIRMRNAWKPIGRLNELNNEDEIVNLDQRRITFDFIKSSLLPFKNTKLCLKFLLRLLQVLNVVIPGMDDMSQFGLIHEILPDDFNFFFQNYTGMADFLVEFMLRLSKSKDIPNVEQILLGVILTRSSFSDFEDADNMQKIYQFEELQIQISKMNFSQQANYCVLLCIYEKMVKCWGLQTSLVGEEENDYDSFSNVDLESNEWKAIMNLLRILRAGDPCRAPDEYTKQIVLWASYFVTTILPSNRINSTINRLRFLTLLVNCQLDKFLDKKFELTAEMVDNADKIWSYHMKAAKNSSKSGALNNADCYSFMRSSNDLIFMLHTMFRFECTKESPFTKFYADDVKFVERSKTRLLFQLDFAYQLWKIHVFNWSEYSNLVKRAVKLYPNVSGFYRHLTNIFELKACRNRHFVEWKLLDPKLKNRYAFSMFAAEYKLFNQACQTDDMLFVDQIYKRICKIFEESTSLVSNTSIPDSFMWRLWHYISRQNKTNISDIEKVYLLGVRSCPFSKQLLIDVTQTPFAKESTLDEIKSLASSAGLNLFSIPEEADALLQAALK